MTDQTNSPVLPVVAWQYRNDYTGTDWEDCAKDFYDQVKANPAEYDEGIKVRELITLASAEALREENARLKGELEQAREKNEELHQDLHAEYEGHRLELAELESTPPQADAIRNEALEEALRDLIIRYTGLFDSYAKPTYRDSARSASDLSLALETANLALTI